jgi:hypothetical protein
MRRNALLASAALLLAAAPGLAQTEPPRQVAAASRPASAPSVLVRTGQHAAHGRVVLHLAPLPPHALRKIDNGWELRLRGQYEFDLGTIRPLAEVSAIEARQEGEESVLLLRSAAESRAVTAAGGGMLWVDVRAGAAAPATPAAQAASPAPAAAAPSAATPPPRGTRQEAERRRLADRAVEMGLMTREQAEASLRAAAQATPASTPAPAGPDPDAAIRESLLAQIGRMNATPPAPRVAAAPTAPTTPAASSAAPPPQAPQPAAAEAPPLPSCPAPFSMNLWQPGSEPARDRLAALRQDFARSEDGIEQAAALAEFYVAHLLAHEALALVESRPAESMPSPAEARLARAGDVARLLLRRPPPASSPLLAEAPGCTREDLPLWRALVAATTNDGAAVARQVPQARAALREVPDRLRYAFALILADAVGDDAGALRTLLAPLRTTPEANEAERAGRAWLQARIARLEGNREEEAQLLARAAQAARTLPGLFARVRLAGLQAARSGPEGARAETQLLDLLRTYRFDTLGEEAAITLGNLLLARGDYAGALAAGESAGSATAQAGVESRGAQLVARILRRLLTEEVEGFPPEERLALWWRYEGYATPGERGDDIRLGAARLLLAKGFTEAALETLRGLAPATAATPDAASLIAQAEAAAPQGDPQRALALLRALPATRATQRATAAALARLDRPTEAAAALDGLTDLQDRVARAGHLYAARNWAGAVAAYADLLRDPALEASARAEMTARYASATALAGARPGGAVPDSLLSADDASRRLLQLAGPARTASSEDQGIASVRAALERARGIEGLIPPQGTR